MKILIAVPCMDLVPAQFASSLATLRKVGECVVAFQMGSLIYNSRNELAKKAIELECDYIFWLDSDMVFDPDTLEKLMNDRENGDIVSGLYFRRVQPFSPVVFSQLQITDKGGCIWKNQDTVPGEIFPVEGCGFGCVLMPTSAVADVMAKFGNAFAPINGVGEDLSFCWRVRQCGYKIVCDPNIKLGHVGHHVITEQFYDSFKNVRAA